jgi:integrase/recombinase XerD
VTWRTDYVLGFRLTAWDRDWPSLPVPAGREVPDDHRRPIHRAHNPARLHRPERLALAGLLAGSRGLTREASALDLRQFTSWCRARSLVLFTVRRADIEGFARDLEAKGRARAMVTRRCAQSPDLQIRRGGRTPGSFPAPHVWRPRVDYESHAVALDRNELDALLVAAGPGTGEHALICLLALNGLRVSETTSADIERLGLERGHRTLTITRKGGTVVTVR